MPPWSSPHGCLRFLANLQPDVGGSRCELDPFDGEEAVEGAPQRDQGSRETHGIPVTGLRWSVASSRPVKDRDTLVLT